MFDKGAFTIKEDLSLIGLDGSLKVHRQHEIEINNLGYHKEHIYINDLT
jgi:putative restriction endonuclease